MLPYLLLVSVMLTVASLYFYIAGFKKTPLFVIHGILFVLLIATAVAIAFGFSIAPEFITTNISSIHAVYFSFLTAALLAIPPLSFRLENRKAAAKSAGPFEIEIIVVYVFCAIYPAQHYISNNFDAFTIETIVKFILIALLPPLLAFSILCFYVRPLISSRMNYLINLSAAVIIFVIYMRPLADGISTYFAQATGFQVHDVYTFLIIGIVLFYLGIRFQKLVTKFLALILLMMTGNFGYSYYAYSNIRTDTLSADINNQLALEKKPSIYIIVADGYLNSEGLRLKGLEKYSVGPDLYNRGFNIYEDAYSNYKPSFPSLISFLNVDHHLYSFDPDPHIVTSGKNRLFSTLHSNGYKTIVAHPGDFFLRGKCNSDLCYPSPNIFGEMGFILAETIFYQKNFINRTNVDKAQYEKEFYGILENTISPTVVYSHVLRPGHSPRDCKNYSRAFRKYETGLKEANKWIGNTVNKIEQIDDRAIIIILGDHGAFLSNNCTWDKPDVTSKETIVDNLGILMAVKWPEDYDNRYDKSIHTLMDLSWYLLQYLSDSGLNQNQKPQSVSYLKSRNKIYKVTQDGLVIDGPKSSINSGKKQK